MSKFLLSTTIAVTALFPLSTPADHHEKPSLFDNKETILFLGDSITQNGHYVALVETYLWASNPERDIEIVNIGQSGETVSGDSEPTRDKRRPYVLKRIDKILETVSPQLTFICYGMNDGIYRPGAEELKNHYIGGIRILVDKLKAVGSEVVLLTPPPFDAASKEDDILQDLKATEFSYQKPYRDYDTVLAGYGEWVMEEGAELRGAIDLGTPVRKWIADRRSTDPTFKHGDGVHPAAEGHLAMALALLEGAGENAERAESILAELTGLTLFPSDQSPTPLGDQILKRHRALSTAYRNYVARGGTPESLAQAIANGGAAEQEIRNAIKTATAKIPAAK